MLYVSLTINIVMSLALLVEKRANYLLKKHIRQLGPGRRD